MATAGPRYYRPGDASKTGGTRLYPEREKKGGPSTFQILAVVTLFPLGFLLLCLAAVTLAGTLIASVVAAPVFILFSPIIVPAALTMAAAVGGFLTSEVFGVMALSSVSWLLNYVRRIGGRAIDQLVQSGRESESSKKHDEGVVGGVGEAIERPRTQLGLM